MNDRPIRVLLTDDDRAGYVLTREWLAEISGGGFELDWQGTWEA